MRLESGWLRVAGEGGEGEAEGRRGRAEDSQQQATAGHRAGNTHKPKSWTKHLFTWAGNTQTQKLDKIEMRPVKNDKNPS